MMYCGHSIPGQNCEECPVVRRDNLPHERHPFKENVWNVENGEKPLVLRVILLQGFAHTSGLGIADITAIQDGAEV